MRGRLPFPILILGGLMYCSPLFAQQPAADRSRESRQLRAPGDRATQELQRALDQIGDYRIGIEGLQRPQNTKSRNVTETINPFRVRNWDATSAQSTSFTGTTIWMPATSSIL